MKLATLNVRGLRWSLKKRVVRSMVRKKNLDFLCIQETKLKIIDYNLCSNLWDGSDVECIFQPSIGKSRGLLNQNIWGMKSIPKLFELYSGLKINFTKSNLYGLNIEEDHMKRISDYLLCKLYSQSFSYLRIYVGVNHIRKNTWKHLIERIHYKLSS
ncbi:hypothetical protein Lal_00029397 [Lupinus albus]|nr:hypothetical protein Lal_00029397 [Lupinus albus]